MEKIAVIAGTMVDTNLGCEILKEKNYDAKSFALSKTCHDQNLLQFVSKKELELIVEEKIKEIKSKNIRKILVYCNSLSSVIDFKKLEKKHNIKIVTPFDAYKKLSKSLEYVLILAANSASTFNIESYMANINKKLEFASIVDLNLVYLIENEIDKNNIIKKSGVEYIFKFFENIITKKKKSILLSCTHFPYIKYEMKKLTNIDIVDPKDIMLEELKGEENA